MDSKKLLKNLMFILTYEILNKDTRYTLICLMECQNLFKAESSVKIYPSFMKQKFDIPQDRLDKILEYLHNAGWVQANHFENHYEVTINYEKIENVRTKTINYYKNVKKGN